MFGVYIHETNVKTSRLLKTFTNKLEARSYLEETVDEFITKKDGEERGRKILFNEPSSYKSSSWKMIPFKYFKTRNTKDSLYKITVWNKTKRTGYLYNSYDIDKIFSIDIIYLPKSLMKIEDNDNDIFYHYDSDFSDDLCGAECFDREKHFKQHKEKMAKVLPLIKKNEDSYEQSIAIGCSSINI